MGCAGGAFGAGLKRERDVEVWGVEPIHRAAELARDRLDCVIEAPFDDKAAIPDAHFDVVLFADSLEHFTETEPVLALAHRKLRSGGSLLCSLPNVRFFPHLQHLLIDGDWEYADEGILDRTHYRFFTMRSARRTIEAADFRVLDIQGITPHHVESFWQKRIRWLYRRYAPDLEFMQFVVVANKQ